MLSYWTENFINSQYSGPCDLRPLYFTIPCILRPDICGTTCIFSVLTSLYFKTTFNLRPYFARWMGGLKSQRPLYITDVIGS